MFQCCRSTKVMDELAWGNQQLQQSAPKEPKFHLFTNLSNELQRSIVAFVADAPYERLHRYSMLARSLPFVSRNFRTICQHEDLWSAALQRAQNAEKCWRSAFARYTETVGTEAVDSVPSNLLYRSIMTMELLITAPVFIMRMGLPAGGSLEAQPVVVSYQLNFFEPRYILMIDDLMEGQPPESWRNGEIVDNLYFIHANQGYQLGGPALLIRLKSCQVFADRRGQLVYVVDLQVVANVRLEEEWVRPRSGGLHYAKALRLDDRL